MSNNNEIKIDTEKLRENAGKKLDNVSENTGFKVEASDRRRSTIVIGVLLLLLVSGMVGMYWERNELSKNQQSMIEQRIIRFVKNETYRNTTKPYGEEFDSFFNNPKWEYFESTCGNDIVQFTGKTRYRGTDVDVLVQFVYRTNPERIMIEFMSFNEIPQDRPIMSSLLTEIFYGEFR